MSVKPVLMFCMVVKIIFKKQAQALVDIIAVSMQVNMCDGVKSVHNGEWPFIITSSISYLCEGKVLTNADYV